MYGSLRCDNRHTHLFLACICLGMGDCGETKCSHNQTQARFFLAFAFEFIIVGLSVAFRLLSHIISIELFALIIESLTLFPI